MLLPVLALIFAGTAITAWVLLGEPQGDPVQQRLKELQQHRPQTGVELTTPHPQLDEDKKTWKEALTAGLDKLVARRSFAMRLEARLRKADWRLHVSEFMLFQFAGSAAGAVVGFILLGKSLWWLLLAAGFMLPYLLLARREKERQALLDAQLPDALTLIANSLKSGYSFLQAMDVVSREMPDPISREFGQVLKENRVGIPLEDAMERLVQRCGSDDLEMAVTAILIQRQVGGNLAEVLEKITDTIKERVRLLGEIRALSAQGRMSGWIVSLLPIGMAVAIQAINPDYLKPLYGSTAGQVMIGIGCVMLFIGITMIRRMVRIEM